MECSFFPPLFPLVWYHSRSAWQSKMSTCRACRNSCVGHCSGSLLASKHVLSTCSLLGTYSKDLAEEMFYFTFWKIYVCFKCRGSDSGCLALPNGALCLSVLKHGRQSLSPRNPLSRPQIGFRKIASVEEMHCNSCLPLPYFFSSALSKGKGACLRHILQRGGGAFRTKQDLVMWQHPTGSAPVLNLHPSQNPVGSHVAAFPILSKALQHAPLQEPPSCSRHILESMA